MMIRKYKIRRLIGPTAGFRKSVLLTLLGLLILFIGSAFSFKILILPALQLLERTAREFLVVVVQP